MRPHLRRDHRGFSALYGAFGVILVSTLIIGTVLATQQARVADPGAEDELASAFLQTLLASDVADETTLEQAIPYACLVEGCDNPGLRATDLNASIAILAAPLARAFERGFLVVISSASAPTIRVGTIAPAAGQGSSSADIYRPLEGNFASISVRLAPL